MQLQLKERIKILLKNPTTWRVLTMGALLAVTNAGYCADAKPADLEAELSRVQSIIFGKQIRTVVLLFGMAWGFFKTFIGGTFTPILLYGGLGLCFFLVPKLIQLINSAA